MDVKEDNIAVEVKLFGNFRIEGKASGEAIKVEMPQGSTTDQLIEKFELTDVKIVSVNYVIHEKEFTLSDGDEVSIFPAIAGG